MTAVLDVVDVKLVDELLRAGGPVTLAGLERRLKGTAVQLAERVEKLRQHGCVIEAHPQQGVRLISTGLSVWGDYIEAHHRGKIGCVIKVFKQTASTQEVVKTIVRADPTGHVNHVVVADEQTAGRGRLGRRWTAGAGEALLLTAVARRESGGGVDRLMLASCQAVAETIESLGSLKAEVRWPNDVLIGGAKVAGILVEMIEGTAVIGIGMNVLGSPRKLPLEEGFEPRATSLHEQGVEVDRLRVLDVLLERLDHAVYHVPNTALAAAWRQRSCLTRRRVTVMSEGKRLTGQVIDIDPMHGLLMQVEHGPVVTLAAATTSLIG
jgi:BirA family biotin operon repressor/biotin-[acetyl-CoA-carboxylase] ligase